MSRGNANWRGYIDHIRTLRHHAGPELFILLVYENA